jgi:N-acetylglutamate synthase-like GNAT family acetyltransferase
MLAPALELMTRANPALLSSGTYYVAESQGGILVGCGGWTREQPGDGNTKEGIGHIRHFATHPEWIRRGIGSAIYRRCETDARKAGIIRFECYSSLNAAVFYSALGFERICLVDIEMTPNVLLTSLHLHRRLCA